MMHKLLQTSVYLSVCLAVCPFLVNSQ